MVMEHLHKKNHSHSPEETSSDEKLEGVETSTNEQNPETTAPAQDQNEALAKSLQETKEQLLRALAETDNLRKRAQKEKEETAQYAITKFARDLLGVADNLNRAIESLTTTPTPPENDAFVEGVKITEKELLKVFEQYKIKQIEALGQPFNPHFHQAMFEQETTDHPAGTVMTLIQTGYTISDRLLRPALVGVAKQKDPSPSESSAAPIDQEPSN